MVQVIAIMGAVWQVGWGSCRMSEFVNVAAYKFAPLGNPVAWRDRLRRAAQANALKGTILLSHEGINLFLAGRADHLEMMLDELRQIPGFADLQAKYSPSDHQPFSRLLVRVRQAIIPFDQPGIAPHHETVPAIRPEELKSWLDERRPVLLLDVRNNYEVEVGSFAGAIAADIDHFREFPGAVERLPAAWRTRPVVMFCTGGIRCEKAGPFMAQRGFQQVYQLEGGILKYFEAVGGDHYDGACFVFDKRVAVGPDLQEVGFALCYACQAAVTPAEQTETTYVPGVSCPRCFVPPAIRQAERLRQRDAALAEIASPLPGSIPYENHRPLNVSAKYAGLPLIDYLSAAVPALDRDAWLAEIAAGRIVCDGKALRINERVRDGQRLVHVQPGTVEPPVATDIRFLYEDDALIVVDKPAPLPMHPCGRFHRNTLTYLLDRVYSPLFPRPQHRLDAATTGVVVLAKTKRYANFLRIQFQERTVSKLYLALSKTAPASDEFEVNLPIAAVPSAGGRRATASDGKPSSTAIRVLQRLADGQTLLAIRPTTGRTNQIRVHLAALGHPIAGDQGYHGDSNGERPLTMRPGDPPLCLCHYQIELRHPLTQELIRFTAHRPAWLPEVDLPEIFHD